MLSGLEIRKDQTQEALCTWSQRGDLEDDLNALLNQPIRTVVIKNWPNVDFLHLVLMTQHRECQTLYRSFGGTLPGVFRVTGSMNQRKGDHKEAAEPARA